MDKPFINVLIVAVALGAIYLFIKSKRRMSGGGNTGFTKPINLPIGQQVDPPKKLSYIYLSILNNYLKRYNIPHGESAFFSLIDCIIADGKKYALKKVHSEIFTANTNVSEQCNKILLIFDSLAKENLSLHVPTAQPDETSPRIFKSAVERYLIDYSLETLANEDFEKALITLFHRLYDSGKKQFLKKFEVNIKWINEYMRTNDKSEMMEAIKKLKSEISEYNKSM